MGRLIDADAFEKSVMFGDAEDMQDVIYALREFPTAYDPDRVVEQLENERKFWENAYDRDIGKEKARSYAHAIEIVRGKQMRKIVEKKILPKYFDAVICDQKKFEIRKDEDDLQVGDTVVLREWDGKRYTGRESSRSIEYILRDVPEYGLMPGYVIFGW